MNSDRIAGPFIFHDTMNAERYLTMLRDEVWPIISAWDNIEDLIFKTFFFRDHHDFGKIKETRDPNLFFREHQFLGILASSPNFEYSKKQTTLCK